MHPREHPSTRTEARCGRKRRRYPAGSRGNETGIRMAQSSIKSSTGPNSRSLDPEAQLRLRRIPSLVQFPSAGRGSKHEPDRVDLKDRGCPAFDFAEQVLDEGNGTSRVGAHSLLCGCPTALPADVDRHP